MSEYDKFVEDLKQFCLAHGYEIAGVGDSIYGTIIVAKIGEDPGWSRWDENKFNFEKAAP